MRVQGDGAEGVDSAVKSEFGLAAGERVLVVKLADIGDLLTATPALRALRETFSSAEIDLLTTPSAAAVVPSRLVDRVYRMPRTLVQGPSGLSHFSALATTIRSRGYAAVLFLHHMTLKSGALKYRLIAGMSQAPLSVGLDNGNGAWLSHRARDEGFGAYHEVEYWLKVVGLLGATTENLELEAQVTSSDRAWANDLLSDLGNRPLVTIHPGSGGYAMARRWEPEKWAVVGDALAECYGTQVVLVGTAADGAERVSETMLQPVLDLTGGTTLPQLAALLERSTLFLGADSGVMHLAAAARVPIVALFGPSNHLAWAPWVPGGRVGIVRAQPFCSPCSYVEHSVGLRDGCWHRSCMADLQPERVLAEVAQLGVLGQTG
ncbi:MAG: glycosyltransferase family 9 protein [Chloroflexota bacterium]|nr:glycosyltransferase family 9 protein [Chloroflexota bacterium]